MSLIVSSTTDSQEAVNAAAGLPAGESATAQEPTPQTPGAPETPPPEPTDPVEETGDEPEEQGDPREQPKKKGGFQRKIERLERQLDEAQYELARRAGQERPGGPPAQAPAKPVQEQFQSYNEYMEALMAWHADQRDLQRDARENERRAAERQAQQVSGWHEKVNQFRESHPMFDDTLADVAHIIIPPVLQQAMLESEYGPALAYELAKDPETLQRIVHLSPLAAVRELGRFEALKVAPQANKKPVALSKAPEPIRPVGQGAQTAAKDPGEMSYEEYKKWRNNQIKRRRAA